jgi:hypothetical protein
MQVGAKKIWLKDLEKVENWKTKPSRPEVRLFLNGGDDALLAFTLLGRHLATDCCELLGWPVFGSLGFEECKTGTSLGFCKR